MLGDHHMGAKMTFFEGAAHVPMMIKPPTMNPLYKAHKGEKIDGVNELSSIYNTILQMAGIEPKAHANHSLLDFDWAKQDKTYYGCCEHLNYAVMENGYKYIYTARGGAELLFNLPDDPYEQHNLAGLPEYAETAAILRGKLIDWAKHYDPELVKDGGLRSEPAFERTEDSNHWPGYHSTECEEFDTLH